MTALDESAKAAVSVAVTRWVRIGNDLRFCGQFEHGAVRSRKVHLDIESLPAAHRVRDRQRIRNRCCRLRLNKLSEPLARHTQKDVTLPLWRHWCSAK